MSLVFFRTFVSPCRPLKLWSATKTFATVVYRLVYYGAVTPVSQTFFFSFASTIRATIKFLLFSVQGNSFKIVKEQYFSFRIGTLFFRLSKWKERQRQSQQFWISTTPSWNRDTPPAQPTEYLL